MRYGSSILLQLSGTKMLLDCGPSTVSKLTKLGVDTRELEAVFLSHFHIDHTSDLPDLVTSLALDRSGQPRAPEKPVVILGGPGLKGFFESVLKQNPHYSYAAEWVEQLDLVEVVELKPAQELRIGGALVTVAEVDHPNGVAIKVQTSDTSVTYSGDTAPCDSLIELAKGTDVLVHECSFPHELLMGKHTSERGLAEVAARVKPKLLIATHLYPSWEGREHEISRAVGGSCDVKTVIGRDLLEIKL
ncbi:MAG: MBL fold metallo-hydrolase [Thaumarchaeota archaeon]|nr:MBL fold metallo-hydrolase [Candidatus Calditenuaceae archaeon]